MQGYTPFINAGPMGMPGAVPMRPAYPPQGAPPLYIGNLDDTVYEEQLFAHFSKYGAIHSLKIVKDGANGGRSRGFGYINFMQPKDAENARMLAQYDKIGKNPVRLMYKRDVRNNSDTNIFVKNIDPSVTFKELHNLFAQVGNVLTVKIAANSKGESLGYGYVLMDKREDAEKALESLQGRKLKEKEINVATFVPKGQRDVNTHKNLYIKNLPTNLSREEIEKKLKEALEKYGQIISLMAQQNKNDNKWFAFACFLDADAADKALRELHDTDPLGTGEKLYVNWHQPRHDRDTELRRKHQTTKNDTNLYVRDLKPDVTREALESAFKQFGETTSVEVKVNTVKGDEKRGHGFVAFKVATDAAKAQSEGHRNPAVAALFVNEVYINFWQPKQQREQYKFTKNRYNRQHRGPFPGNFMGAPMFPPRMGGYPMMGPGYPMPFMPGGYQRGVPQYGRPYGQGPRGGNLGGGIKKAYQPDRRPQQHGQAGGQYNNQRQNNHYVNKNGPARDQQGYRQNQSRGDERKRSQPQQQPSATQSTTQSKDFNQGPALEGPHLTVNNLKEKLDDFLKLEADKQRNILGELLFPRIVAKSGPQLAPKITGMLVDFDVLTVQDILEMLEDDGILLERIKEAEELINQEGETQ